jgi:hypothetical protein
VVARLQYPEDRPGARASVSPHIALAVAGGTSFDVSTGLITLPGSTQYPVLYVRNESDDYLQIVRFVFSIGPASAPGPAIIQLHNAGNASGTLLEPAAQSAVVGNRNFGVRRGLKATTRVWSPGRTLSGLEDMVPVLHPPGAPALSIPSEILLPQDAALALSITPPPGAINTAVSVYLVVALLRPEEL